MSRLGRGLWTIREVALPLLAKEGVWLVHRSFSEGGGRSSYRNLQTRYLYHFKPRLPIFSSKLRFMKCPALNLKFLLGVIYFSHFLKARNCVSYCGSYILVAFKLRELYFLFFQYAYSDVTNYVNF